MAQNRKNTGKPEFLPSETPFARPVVVDSNGNNWRERPDYRVRQELLKAGVDDEEYLDADQLLNDRDWYGLKSHLSSVADRMEKESRLRVEKAMTICQEVIEKEKERWI